MANINTLKKIAKISKITGFTSLCYKLNKNRKKIIAYHNVIPDEYYDNSLHLAHSMKESSFKKQLEIIEKRFGTTLDIYDSSKITLTFDDGYNNQYSVASKLMDEKNMKGYFFCVTNIIKYNEPFILDKLQCWFSYVPIGVYNLNELGISLNIKDEDSRVSEWKKIDKFIGEIPIEHIEELINQAYSFSKIGMDEKFYNLRYKNIEYKELNDMKSRGHKIGAHSSNHKRLSIMDEKELQEDIGTCGNLLGNIFNTDIFCYPFGSKQDINCCVIKEVKKNGFSKALAYSNGPIEEGYDDYFVPRMFLYDTSDKDLIDFILSGAKHFISFKTLLPIIKLKENNSSNESLVL